MQTVEVSVWNFCADWKLPPQPVARSAWTLCSAVRVGSLCVGQRHNQSLTICGSSNLVSVQPPRPYCACYDLYAPGTGV